MTNTYTTPAGGGTYKQDDETIERFHRLSTADLEPKDCKARNEDLRCVLDAHHVELGTRHMHRTVCPETNQPVVISFIKEST